MQLQEEQICLQEAIKTNQHYPEIIGQSFELQQTLDLISKVAATNTTVLMLGETGTGKELVARAVHNNSLRRAKTMIKVNCATLPSNLIESESFGHERGSFTGAFDRRVGKFESANNSTLFLDEIGEMPLELQVKLLRALQEREIERIGGAHPIKIDVRIIAATNRDLAAEVEAGRFRADLYYRLNIYPHTDLPSGEKATDRRHIFSRRVGDENNGRKPARAYHQRAQALQRQSGRMRRSRAIPRSSTQYIKFEAQAPRYPKSTLLRRGERRRR
jgi:formate hydrogenlyase transcriptional activator